MNEYKKIMILNSLTEEEMAQRLNVTAQDVKSWVSDESTPDEETLKLISKEFNVPVNTLLGKPKTLFCQCCGIPLSEDFFISREPDGSFNEDYCMNCYSNGEFKYKTKDELIDFYVTNLPNPNNQPDEERRQMINDRISGLKHWK
ncbi:MAG: helix-turn-helix domain-containing protein [Ruminococcus sp.]|nr:helix-turn-helix domain-containing protein [Ruminococcus sp.]